MKTKKRIGTANAVFHFDSRKEGICEATPFGSLYKNALAQPMLFFILTLGKKGSAKLPPE
jgi:hypothetical protein